MTENVALLYRSMAISSRETAANLRAAAERHRGDRRLRRALLRAAGEFETSARSLDKCAVRPDDRDFQRWLEAARRHAELGREHADGVIDLATGGV